MEDSTSCLHHKSSIPRTKNYRSQRRASILHFPSVLALSGLLLLISGNFRFSYRRAASILFGDHRDDSSNQLLRVNEAKSSSPIFIIQQQQQQQSSSRISSSTINNASSKTTKFYILPILEMTDWLLGNHTEEAYHYYGEKALNEDQAEVWLHRAWQQHPSRTNDPKDADVIVICGYLHFQYHLSKSPAKQQQQHKRRPGRQHASNNANVSSSSATTFFNAKEFAQHVAERVAEIDPTHQKPCLLSIPTTNPTVSRFIGIKALVKALTKKRQGAGKQSEENRSNSYLWSLGFERNQYWQGGIPPERIIPIPYVVKMPLSSDTTSTAAAAISNTAPSTSTSSITTTPTTTKRTPDFIFYAGDRRQHAIEWSGCDRAALVQSLTGAPNMDVRLVEDDNRSRNSSSHTKTIARTSRQQQQQQYRDATTTTTGSKRLTQQEYNHRMQTSDYCLILCGDSPTSRSFTSAVIHGCIPVRIGSRLRGLCEPPCHKGWGWTISGRQYPHLAYYNRNISSATNEHHHVEEDRTTRGINWDMFPEVDERSLLLASNRNTNYDSDKESSNNNNNGYSNDAVTLLREALNRTEEQKAKLRSVLVQHREGFIYGWGNPVNATTTLGQAGPYIWDSFVMELFLQGQERSQFLQQEGHVSIKGS